MKVVIDIDEKFSNILSITAVGKQGYDLNVSTYAADLSHGTKLKIDEYGKGYQAKEGDSE